MTLDGIWAVCQFEYRRHLRWRPFWRALVGVALLTLMGTALTLWLATLFARGRIISGAQPFLFQMSVAAPGVAAFVVATGLAVQIFSDRTKRGVLPDMFMTALHPLEVVLGRLLTVGMLTAVAMFAVVPVSIAMALLAGVSLVGTLSSLWVVWLTAMLWAALVAGASQRTFPEPESSESELPRGSQRPARAEFGGMVVIVLFSLFLYLLITGYVASKLGFSIHLPLLGLLPFIAPLEVLLPYRLGSWQLPAGLVLGLSALAGMALAVMATAQRLGWWSESGYRLQRWAGTGSFLLFVGLNAAIFATEAVQSPVAAQTVVFWATLFLGGLGVGLGIWLMGYYGVALRPSPLKCALPVPLGGVVWEWAMLWGVALAIWLGVGLVSSYWVAPLRWLLTTAYFWCLLVLLQSFGARSLLGYLRQRVDEQLYTTHQARLQLASGGYQSLEMLLPLMVVFIVLFILPRNLIQQIASYVLPLLPLGAIDSPHHPLWRYALYGLYALGVAGLLWLFAWMKTSRSQAQTLSSE